MTCSTPAPGTCHSALGTAVFGRVPPLRSGPGCARRRQRYNRCQRRRAPCAAGHDTAVPACSGFSALRARIPHATAEPRVTGYRGQVTACNGNGGRSSLPRGPSPPGPLSRTPATSWPEAHRMYGRGGETHRPLPARPCSPPAPTSHAAAPHPLKRPGPVVQPPPGFFGGGASLSERRGRAPPPAQRTPDHPPHRLPALLPLSRRSLPGEGAGGGALPRVQTLPKRAPARIPSQPERRGGTDGLRGSAPDAHANQRRGRG